MARIYYYVVKSGTTWQVKLEGKPALKEFSTQAEAIEFARNSASLLWSTYKKPSGVRIQGRDNLWQDERTYGQDPFPPKG